MKYILLIGITKNYVLRVTKQHKDINRIIVSAVKQQHLTAGFQSPLSKLFLIKRLLYNVF